MYIKLFHIGLNSNMQNVYQKFFGGDFGWSNANQDFSTYMNRDTLRLTPIRNTQVNPIENQVRNLHESNFMNNLQLDPNRTRVPQVMEFPEYEIQSYPKIPDQTQNFIPQHPRQIRTPIADSMKIQQLQDRMQKMEQVHNEDKQRLLDIIYANTIGNPGITNFTRSQQGPNFAMTDDQMRKSNMRDMKRSQIKQVQDELEADNKKRVFDLNEMLKEEQREAIDKEKRKLISGMDYDQTFQTMEKLRATKLDLDTKLNGELKRGDFSREELRSDFTLFQSEMLRKIEKLEQNRQKLMDGLKYILDNSGSKRVKSMANRLLGDCKILIKFRCPRYK